MADLWREGTEGIRREEKAKKNNKIAAAALVLGASLDIS
jgi:hypothetical protein